MKRAWVILLVTAFVLTWTAYHAGSEAEASNAARSGSVTIAATGLASPSPASSVTDRVAASPVMPLLLAHGQPFRLEAAEKSSGDDLKKLPHWWVAEGNGEENGDEEEGEGDEEEDGEENGDEEEKEDPYERMWNSVTLG